MSRYSGGFCVPLTPAGKARAVSETSGPAAAPGWSCPAARCGWRRWRMPFGNRRAFTVRTYGTGPPYSRISAQICPDDHETPQVSDPSAFQAADLVTSQSLGLGGVGFPRNWGRVMAAGGHGPGLRRQVCCPCAGRRRDRFQGGRCRAGCPAGVSRAAVSGWRDGPGLLDDRGVLPVTPFKPWCLRARKSVWRWGRSCGLGYCRFEHADQIRLFPAPLPGQPRSCWY